MESSICCGIGSQPIAFFIHLIRSPQIFACVFGKVVLVDEVIARVIRWIDVDHLDLAQIRLLQQLQRIQVVAFDEQVLRRIEI